MTTPLTSNRTLTQLADFVGSENLFLQKTPPAVCPRAAAEVKSIVAFACGRKIPLAIQGNGAHLPVSDPNRVVVSLERLNRVVELASDDLYVTLEAGFPLGVLNQTLSPHKVAYPLSQAGYNGTVGGSVAMNLSATLEDDTIQTKTYLMALEAVTGYGELVKLGAKTYKSVAGYDVARFLCGSWGRLAVITKVTLRLIPLRLQKQYEKARLIDPIWPWGQAKRDPALAALENQVKSQVDPTGILP